MGVATRALRETRASMWYQSFPGIATAHRTRDWRQSRMWPFCVLAAKFQWSNTHKHTTAQKIEANTQISVTHQEDSARWL